MGKFQDDDLPYQTNLPAPGRVAKSETQVKNAEEYSTLKVVEESLALGLEGLYNDFNAFDIEKLKDKPTTAAVQSLLREIEAKQLAYSIIKPLYDTVVSAIRQVEKD